MYRPETKPRDRAATIAAVLLIHAGLALAVLNMSGHIDLTTPQPTLQTFDVTDPPPPPVIVQDQAKPKPKDDEGAASAPNIKSKATPVVAPKPMVVVPTPPRIVATPTPNTGTEATQGAAPVAGPGTGAGGSGTGTGSGGSGSGSGGGGTGTAVGVKLVNGITHVDYPDAVQRGWPRGGAVYARLRVEANGRVSQCDVMRSFGNKNIDDWTCSLLRSRARFQPARDSEGRPVAAWFGYRQGDTGRTYRPR